MIPKRPRKNCIICEEEIFRGKNGVCLKTRRGKNSITCSKKCARTYNRVSKFIWLRFYKREHRK